MPTIQRSKPALQPYHCPAVIPSSLYSNSETLPQYNSDLSSSNSVSCRDTVGSFCRSIQTVASMLHADPEFTQTRVFRFTSPIAVFVSLLTTIASLPQSWYINHDWTGKPMMNHLSELGFLFMIATIVVIGTLGVLWVLIWVSALGIKHFTETDFSTGRRASAGILDNIMGGLFTN
ncbi:hypothetical protein BT96DRAFT_985297 [Gymnopus androsaceus JB14]|uniref:Uncharacterized protein n=1 Tax=Gymnopus androsaceus JB14 TaxID=1447944 RepID=A0A6A4IKC0_9AGAR|nr:hypothetical protein BT96DRAFT_985297 [Gymnopus androsaceus JB14]